MAFVAEAGVGRWLFCRKDAIFAQAMTNDKRRVLLGFSGGMDSVTAVGRLRDDGYDVEALTIDMIGDEDMICRARCRAEEIGVNWHLCDARREFECEVIDYFVDEYCCGRTPAPCTRCNTAIKWQMLARCADEMNIGHIATGHYFNISHCNDRFYVAQADDKSKDQSYYLWGLPQHLLRRAVAPMGRVYKSDVRSRFADKSESMGICFLHGERYGDYIRRRTSRFACGDITDRCGNVVGRHAGIPFYTIGQRRGDGIPEGVCVTGIDAAGNRLIVGSKNDLYYSTIYVGSCNVVDREELLSSPDVTIKIRGIGRNPQRCVAVYDAEDSKWAAYRVECDDPAWAPAVGQPLVFYRGYRVIGGGVITAFG